jgi:pimeloyl-ACP methyl ester carboxylesterase
MALVALAVGRRDDSDPARQAPQEASLQAPRLQRCDLGSPRLFRCGHVKVPVRRGHPALGKLKVAFALRPRIERRRPSLGTIVGVEGGPGYAATDHPYAASLIAALGPLLRRRDLLLIDQRGTGRSGAVHCDPLQRGQIQEHIAVAQCADQLGPRFAAYTTAETADDIDVVRRSLGLGRIFLYGDSYGTLQGQAYAVRHASKLRGLILDAAYPANDPYWRTLYPAFRRGLRIACLHSRCPGRPFRRFRRVVHRFHDAGRPTGDLLGFALEAGTLAPRSYLNLDKADRYFLQGKPRRLNRLIWPGPPGFGDVHAFSYGLEIAVECNDYPQLWDKRAPVNERIRQLTVAVKGLPRGYFAPFTRREYLLSSEAHLTNCLTWPAPPPGGLQPPVPAGWRASRSFPTLILAGQIDDITSVKEARQTARRFPRSSLYVDPNRGHVSSLYFPFRSPAVGVIRHFIRNH